MELGLYTFADVSRDPQSGVALAPEVRLRNLIEEIEPRIGFQSGPLWAVITPAELVRVARPG